MFFLLLRNVKTILRALRLPRVQITDEHRWTSRVRFADLDYNMHKNNSKYLESFELARIAFIIQTGMQGLILKKKYMPLVVSTEVRYITPLKLFEKYEIISKIIYWDAKFFFLNQEIIRLGKNPTTAAIGIFRGVFKGKNGIIPVDQLLKEANHPITSPACPEYLQKMIEAEQFWRDSQPGLFKKHKH